MSEKNKEEQVDECDERLVYEEISTWSLISVFCSNTSGASQTVIWSLLLFWGTRLKLRNSLHIFFSSWTWQNFWHQFKMPSDHLESNFLGFIFDLLLSGLSKGHFCFKIKTLILDLYAPSRLYDLARHNVNECSQPAKFRFYFFL